MTTMADFSVMKFPNTLGMSVIVKNTFLDVVESSSVCPPSSYTRRSSSVPKDCKFAIHIEFRSRPESVSNDSSEASTADPDEGDCICQHEVDALASKSSSTGRILLPVEAAAPNFLEEHFAHAHSDPLTHGNVPCAEDAVCKRDKIAGLLPRKQGPGTATKLTARINALDLHMAPPQRQSLISRRNGTKVAPDRQPKFVVDKANWNNARAGTISECCTVEPSEAPVDDVSEVGTQMGRHPTSSSALVTGDAMAPLAETKVKVSAPLFTPVGRSLGEAGMLVMAAQGALRQCPQIVGVDLTKGAVGSTTTLAARINRQPSPVAHAAQAAMGAAKAALLACAALSQTVYVIGYLSQDPFKACESGMGFHATLAFVKPSEESIVCWDMIQRGFCSHHAACRLRHSTDSELVHLHIICQPCGDVASA